MLDVARPPLLGSVASEGGGGRGGLNLAMGFTVRVVGEAEVGVEAWDTWRMQSEIAV